MAEKFHNITIHAHDQVQVRFSLDRRASYKTFSYLRAALHYRNAFIVDHGLYTEGTVLGLKSDKGPLPTVRRESKVSGILIYHQVHHHNLTLDGPKYAPRQFSDIDEAYKFRALSFAEFNKVADMYNSLRLRSLQEQWVNELQYEIPCAKMGFDLDLWRKALGYLVRV